MKLLYLSKNKTTKVDDEDFIKFNSLKWYCSSNGYACRRTGYPKKKIYYLHRLLLKAPICLQVDHINGDKLDNRKRNLRLVLPILNNRNHRKSKYNKSGHNGIYQCKNTNKWIAQYSYKNKIIYLGKFIKLKEAIVARKIIDKKLGFIIR